MNAQWAKEFDNIIVLDTETTGIDCRGDEIIELAALRLPLNSCGAKADEFDLLIRLSEGRKLPPEITALTGITPEMLHREGVSKESAAERFADLLRCSRPLVVAYNAQFDLCFLFFFLQRCGCADTLRGVKMLDAMTVYKDRRPYPHKLCNAIEAYGLSGENTHRAIDDARATLELLEAMQAEKPDLDRYINLFGYNPKYGVSGPRIGSVRYLPQGYDRRKKLYE